MARNRFDIDENLETPFDRHQFRRLLNYSRPYTRPLVATLFVMIANAALSLMLPFLLKIAIDRGIANADIPVLIWLAIAYLAIAVVGIFLTRYQMRTVNWVGQSVVHDIRLDMMRHLQKLSFTYFDSRPHGKILTRIVHYVNNVSTLISGGLLNAIVELLRLFIIFAYMLILDVQLTLYSLIGMPLLIAGLFWLRGRQRDAQRDFNMKSSNLNAYTQENIQGVTITQHFARETVNAGIFHGLAGRWRHAWQKSTFYGLLFRPLVIGASSLTSTFLYAGSVLWFRRANGAPLEPGTIIAFMAFVSMFWQPIMAIANFYTQLINGASYVERIFEFLDEPIDVEDKPDAQPLRPITGEVTFDNVTFRYAPGEPNILHNTSFVIDPGETIALVGPTGAGKSTLVNLISRFYELNEGRILLDDQDISTVTLDSLRGQMGLMMQEPFLFSGTIMDNIRYGRLDASDEECIAAAKAVRAHEFIMNQPEGYATEIKEHGTGVSAGERQLISFARVMLSGPRLLILDEATSSIDSRTEEALQEGLRSLTAGRTSFIIAHRLSTIRAADRIFYIANQGIAESGSHDELIELDGEYARLYKQQLADLE